MSESLHYLLALVADIWPLMLIGAAIAVAAACVLITLTLRYLAPPVTHPDEVAALDRERDGTTI